MPTPIAYELTRKAYAFFLNEAFAEQHTVAVAATVSPQPARNARRREPKSDAR